MRGSEERLVQIATLPIGRGIQKNQQKYAQSKINRAQAHHPRPLARLHALIEKERNEPNEQINQIELFERSTDVHHHLLAKNYEICRRMNPLVLPSRKRVEETSDRSRIPPVQWWIGHPSQGHVEIKSRAEQPAKTASEST